MDPALIFSIILIWAMCSAASMAWFSAARKRANLRHCGGEEHATGSGVWSIVFLICLIAWLTLFFWQRH